MKLTDRERLAVTQLRSLDAQQRNKLLNDIKRAALTNRIITQAGRKAGALKQLRPAPDHKIVRAFGLLPKSRARDLDHE